MQDDLLTELVSFDHAYDHGTMTFVVILYCTLAAIPATGLVNCSYVKTEIQG